MPQPFAEQLTAINARYTEQLVRAGRYNPVGVKNSSGRMRDKMTAKANREYYEALRRIGIRSRRRAIRVGS